MTDKIIQQNYISTKLIEQIFENNDDLKNQKLIDHKLSASGTLDGFMSAIFKLELTTLSNDETSSTPTTTKHELIVKLMKGDEAFRTASRSNIQFANEIYIYTNVMKSYKDFLASCKSNICIEKWIPRVYYGYYGKIPELSELPETVLSLEDLSSKGYRNGPRHELDETHLLMMTKLISELHAVSYAMKLKKPQLYNEMANEIGPMPYTSPIKNDNMFELLYDIAFCRFFEYFDRISMAEKLPVSFKADMKNLRKKYGDNPANLLEYIRSYNGVFAIILHGDYNRNNVLFQYNSSIGYDNPKDVKMIDFQELRYGTPAFDLSFFMYMSMNENIRKTLWNKLLKYYHENVVNCLADILNCEKDDEILNQYSYENFIEHFQMYAFYGTMVSIQFLPWMLCTDEESSKLTELFVGDMYSKEFRNLSMTIGGDDVNKRFMNNAMHASEMELSDINECILAVENLTSLGYRNGPRCELNEDHLLLMTRLIAEYHAMSYAIKIKQPDAFKELVTGITPLTFEARIGEGNLYQVLYEIGFTRYFGYLDRLAKTSTLSPSSAQHISDMGNLREKYGNKPVSLLERFRQYNDIFSVILHGDYNRNNVLFQYDNDEGYENPKDVKMIDFQELRYGTPAMDLAFYMYMNMDPAIRDKFWSYLLKYYHKNVIRTLTDVLNCSEDDEILKPYSLDNFIQHFSKYAFYGAMVCIHFIPWMVCTEDECNKLSYLFETNMYGDAFRELSIICGGDIANERIFGITQHAYNSGYLNFLQEEN